MRLLRNLQRTPKNQNKSRKLKLFSSFLNVEFAYRFYRLYAIPSNSLVKDFYLSPSIFISWVKPEINSTEHKLTYSVLGNIGLGLMRKVNLALGVVITQVRG